MQLWVIIAMAVICSVAVFVAANQLGKQSGRTSLTFQAPIIAGLIGSVVFLLVCCQQLLTPEQVVTVLWINTILPLSGIVICLLHGKSLLRYHIPITLVIVVAYIVFCTVTMLDFGHSDQMSGLLSVGLFVIKYLLWIFPLAAVLVACQPCKAE